MQDELLVIGFKAQRKKKGKKKKNKKEEKEKKCWAWIQVRKDERMRSVNDVIGL